MKITDCQPDSGNPTVRDERGAYGNVSYGGTRTPLHTPKGCRTETLCLRLRAPYFYPTNTKCQSVLTCVRAGDWEQHPITPSPVTTRVAERLTRLGSLRPTILELSNEGGSPCVCEAHIGVCQLQRCGT